MIRKGYKVKGSLRNINREDEVRKLFRKIQKIISLNSVNLTFLNDAGWDEAASDCDFLLHIASPFTIEEPKKESLIIDPALEGTLRALNAAKNSSKVKKSCSNFFYGSNCLWP